MLLTTTLSRTAALAVLGLLTLAGGIPARAGEAEWKVGLAEVRITPRLPVFLAGYAGRTRPFDKVVSDLHA
jgi:hypothetical protein